MSCIWNVLCCCRKKGEEILLDEADGSVLFGDQNGSIQNRTDDVGRKSISSPKDIPEYSLPRTLSTSGSDFFGRSLPGSFSMTESDFPENSLSNAMFRSPSFLAEKAKGDHTPPSGHLFPPVNSPEDLYL